MPRIGIAVDKRKKGLTETISMEGPMKGEKIRSALGGKLRLISDYSRSCNHGNCRFRHPSNGHSIYLYVRKRIIDTYTYTQYLTELTGLHTNRNTICFRACRKRSNRRRASDSPRRKKKKLTERKTDSAAIRTRVLLSSRRAFVSLFSNFFRRLVFLSSARLPT